MSRTDTANVQESVEPRAHVARILRGRATAIVSDAVGGYPFAGIEHINADDRSALGDLAFQLLTTAVRDGELDAGYPVVSDLGRLAADHDIPIRLLFTLVYLVERSSLDQLAHDESFGVESEPWPALTQLIHAAFLDVCAAAAEHMGRHRHAIVDPLTTLHTKAVFVAALEKEIQRAERFGYPFAVIMLEVDALDEIRAKHGRGAGDRVIERIGIVLRNYFRETDWVGRLGDATFGVLMPDIQGFNAERHAERIRVAVHERLRLRDHRSDEAYAVTVSVGLLVVAAAERAMKAALLLEQAVAAVGEARHAGGNQVVHQRLDS
jgi:diguanylate cyclase (GGDEF)-like protein